MMTTTIDHPLTRDRVREHTAGSVNRRIDAVTDASVVSTLKGGHDTVVRRLEELEREWDIDRALMLNFAVVGGAVFLGGIARYARPTFLGPRRKGLLYFFGTQLAFLGLHAIAGWCPPVVLFRRLGFRTQKEIHSERARLTSARV